MSMLNKKKIPDIIESCGKATNLASDLKVHYFTVLAWKKAGRIPKKYWERIIKLSNLELTIEDLFLAK